MYERQMDAMTYVRTYGRPDLFITMTTNPRWPEIVDNLLPGQVPRDRPDLLALVFRLKVKKFMGFLKGGIFGDMQAWLYSIEFQKRGLPHVHLLVWLVSNDKVHPNMIDNVISAEIPIVKAHMVHGPCSALNRSSPCMKYGKCSKKFPKAFVRSTKQGQDGYPRYRRRSPEDGGHIAIIRMQQVEQGIDNQWIVPYNPWLLRQMNCHVNVELCMSIQSIKYVLKYVNKGCNQAVYTIQSTEQQQNVDEVLKFQQAHFVGSCEAAWRIFDFPLHEHFPPVVQLAVHLENGQRVYFTEQTALEQATAQPPPTTLTEFFGLCQREDFARTLIYAEMPKFYTWEKGRKVWCRCKRGTAVASHPEIFEAPCIGRVYTVSPRQGECYYLRILLHEVKGPQCFEDVKTVNGSLCQTFREACQRRGLMEDDNHLKMALEEAVSCCSPSTLRSLFAIIISACEPANPLSLWLLHHDSMTEDILNTHRQELLNNVLEFTDHMYNQCLRM